MNGYPVNRSLPYFLSNSTNILPTHPTTSYPPAFSHSYINMQSKHLNTNPSRSHPPALPSIFKAYQDAIKQSKYLIQLVTLRLYHRSTITLPVSNFDYWKEIGHTVDTPLATEFCQRLLLGLSSFSWSHCVSQTCDIVPLFSNTSKGLHVTSFHLNHMTTQMKTQYQKNFGPVLPATTFLLLLTMSIGSLNTTVTFIPKKWVPYGICWWWLRMKSLGGQLIT